MNPSGNLLEKIVTEQFCVGCGACSSIDGFKGSMIINNQGMYQPGNLIQTVDVNNTIAKVCPFSGLGEDENDIASRLYKANKNYCSEAGYYEQIYAGHVEEKEFRQKGTSGGVITWLLSYLLESDLVDYVAHVKPAIDKSCLFEYGISETTDEILNGAKSRYYPVEMSQIINFIKNNEGRFVVVGLPCFIKTIRNVSSNDESFAKKIKFCIGLVCGHLKSVGFSEALGYQAGIEPESLKSIDFRVKLKGRPANRYGFTAESTDKTITKPMEGIIGGNWGHNLFRYPACNYCDDIFAETADLTVGDAWLPEYAQDHKGTSIVLVRNQKLLSIVAKGVDLGLLNFDILSESKLLESQEGGLRDRREGLAYRLHRKKSSNSWFPVKRVTPTDKGLSKKRKGLYELREKVSLESHLVWQNAKSQKNYKSFSDYFNKVNAEFDRYADKKSRKKVFKKLKSAIKKVLSLR